MTALKHIIEKRRLTGAQEATEDWSRAMGKVGKTQQGVREGGRKGGIKRGKGAQAVLPGRGMEERKRMKEGDRKEGRVAGGQEGGREEGRGGRRESSTHA